MKHARGKIDLSSWTLNRIENIKQQISSQIQMIVTETLVLEAAGEALWFALDSDDTSASFPAVFGDDDGHGGPRCDDALTIYLYIALGEDNYDHLPVWKTSLREMLATEIDACAEDGSFADGLIRIRDDLRNLADSIDNALLSNKTTE